MFDTSLVDFFVTVPIVLPILFGLIIYKIENSDSVRPIFALILGTAFFSILIFVNVLLNFKFSQISVMVFNGLFKVDKTTAGLSALVTTLTALIYLASAFDAKKRVKSLELYGLLSLFTGLIFANNLIFIFLFSEAVLILTILTNGNRLSLSTLSGSKVRVIGLILLLGSVSINYGAGNALTINFLQSNAESLYASDHLFVLGCLFTLAGLLEILWTILSDKLTEFNQKTLLGGFSVVIVFMKYSSAEIFSLLQETQTLIQWFLVVVLLITSIGVGQSKTVRHLVREGFRSMLLMAMIFSLPTIFDGSGELDHIFNYLAMCSIFIILLSTWEKRLSCAKGADLLLSELISLAKLQPLKTSLFFFTLVSLFSFPLSLAVEPVLIGTKMVLQSGFYWVGCWALFALAVLWISVGKLFNEAYFKADDKDALLLWRDSDLADVNKPLFLFLMVVLAVVPLLPGLFVSL